MKQWKRRKVLAEAYLWRREREAALKAQILIHDRILRSLRTELAELRQLQGQALAARYGWESATEIQATLTPRREFVQHITDLFVEAEVAR